jgi:chaperone protein EcpD
MGHYAHKFTQYLAVAVLCATSMAASASVVISGTRVIYPSDAKEVTVKLTNKGSGPVLIQSWIDNGDTTAKPETISVPFVLTPPINRVEPSKGQTLRLSYTGAALPTNQESVFWLNVLEIPAKAAKQGDENYLQMAFRSRIKLFFRPAGLSGNANDAAKALTWSSSAGGVLATNPTPYYVSLVTVKVNGKEVEGQMVAPGGNQKFALPAAGAGSKVSFAFVNDYGAVNSAESVMH